MGVIYRGEADTVAERAGLGLLVFRRSVRPKQTLLFRTETRVKSVSRDMRDFFSEAIKLFEAAGN